MKYAPPESIPLQRGRWALATIAQEAQPPTGTPLPFATTVPVATGPPLALLLAHRAPVNFTTLTPNKPTSLRAWLVVAAVQVRLGAPLAVLAAPPLALACALMARDLKTFPIICVRRAPRGQVAVTACNVLCALRVPIRTGFSPLAVTLVPQGPRAPLLVYYFPRCAL